MPGKIDAPLNNMLENVEWGEFRLGELFEIKRGLSMYVNDKNSFSYIDKNKKESIRLVQQMRDNNGIVAYIDKTKLPKKFLNKIEKAGQITINPDQPLSFYQEEEFIGNSVIIVDTSSIGKNACLFIVSQIQRIRKNSTWNDKFPKEQVKIAKIQLPIKNKQIDFDFMENFIAELEAQRIAELEAYLSVSGLKDYNLTDEEKNVLEDFENLKWNNFNIKKLFGTSTRGKRLKSDDRILGNLPFVTAGEKDQGISDFISNNVEIFSNNTTTIDMFGSAKYRNYKYGGDDHIAVVHTEKLSKFSAIFTTTSIHKSSYTDKFSYSRNFYAKDADELNIQLPTKNSRPDYSTMEIFISAIQKLVIKDVVLYSERKLNATKNIVNKDN